MGGNVHASGPGWIDPTPLARGDPLRGSAEAGGAGHPCLQGRETPWTPYTADFTMPRAADARASPPRVVLSAWVTWSQATLGTRCVGSCRPSRVGTLADPRTSQTWLACGLVRVEGTETRYLPGRDRGVARSGAAPSPSKHSPALGKAEATCARAWSARGTSAHSQVCRGVADQR